MHLRMRAQRENKRAARPAARRPTSGTKARALDTALALFEKHRASGYTVHAVVAASGISLGSLYHHFGSMDGLSAALYSRSMASLLDFIGDAAESAQSPRAIVAAITKAYLEFTARERATALFIHAAPVERFLPEHIAAIAADKAPRLERIVAALRPHVRSGAVVALPEPILEMLIIGPVAEIARRWLAGAPGIELDEAARLVPERIWRSVRVG
jgi:AcrR family transcriptional regulator